MPYEQLEDIRSRRQEKVAVFLTAQHVGGLLCVTVPVYIATLQFSFLLRTLLLITAAILGICLTLEIGGLPCYERLLWRVRGAVRVRTTTPVLSPEQFTGVPAVHIERALPAGGPIRVVLADTSSRKRWRRAGHDTSALARNDPASERDQHSMPPVPFLALPSFVDLSDQPTDEHVGTQQACMHDALARTQTWSEVETHVHL